jgi:hypothetical protein
LYREVVSSPLANVANWLDVDGQLGECVTERGVSSSSGSEARNSSKSSVVRLIFTG